MFKISEVKAKKKKRILQIFNAPQLRSRDYTIFASCFGKKKIVDFSLFWDAHQNAMEEKLN